MRSKTVTRTSIFPASQEQVFQLLKELKTLPYIASPYASFLPIDGRGSPVWEEGARLSLPPSGIWSHPLRDTHDPRTAVQRRYL